MLCEVPQGRHYVHVPPTGYDVDRTWFPNVTYLSNAVVYTQFLSDITLELTVGTL